MSKRQSAPYGTVAVNQELISKVCRHITITCAKNPFVTEHV